MTARLLLKGFEVELFTGRQDGSVVGCADDIARAFPGFMLEPDRRNLEYATAPEASYEHLLCQLLQPRRQLRPWLAQRQLTLLPGSCLSLGESGWVERSDPDNPYHTYIEQHYGSRVVTASVHLNFGIPHHEQLMGACRLLRCEAALLLALSASSPFLDGQDTGFHSQRWRQLPITPSPVPLFRDYRHYVSWMEEQLERRTMFNVRHLWCSVRPNGNQRPYDLNRIELRICDLLDDPMDLLAIAAFCELRLQQLLAAPEQHDPLRASTLDAAALANLADQNDQAAAHGSLHARLRRWQDGAATTATAWLEDSLHHLAEPARQYGLEPWLRHLRLVMKEGNRSMRWLRRFRAGESIRSIMQKDALAMERRERELALQICEHKRQSLSALLRSRGPVGLR